MYKIYTYTVDSTVYNIHLCIIVAPSVLWCSEVSLLLLVVARTLAALIAMLHFQAGMASPTKQEKLLIALEPEAAAIYCRRLRQNQLLQDKSDARFKRLSRTPSHTPPSSLRSTKSLGDGHPHHFPDMDRGESGFSWPSIVEGRQIRLGPDGICKKLCIVAQLYPGFWGIWESINPHNLILFNSLNLLQIL